MLIIKENVICDAVCCLLSIVHFLFFPLKIYEQTINRRTVTSLQSCGVDVCLIFDSPLISISSNLKTGL